VIPRVTIHAKFLFKIEVMCIKMNIELYDAFAGMFTFSVLAMLPFTNGAFSKICGDYYREMMELSVASSVIGGALMGLGMTISGSVVFLHYCTLSQNGPSFSSKI